MEERSEQPDINQDLMDRVREKVKPETENDMAESPNIHKQEDSRPYNMSNEWTLRGLGRSATVGRYESGLPITQRALDIRARFNQDIDDLNSSNIEEE